MKSTTRKITARVLVVFLALLITIVIVIGCGSPTTVPPVKTGAPVQLVFIEEPSEAIAGSPFNPRAVVAAVDEEGNVVTSYRGLATLSITPGSGVNGAQLFGGTTATLLNGMVEFRNISIDKAGAGYTLTVACGSLAPATSKPFTVSPGAPYKLAFTVQPSGGVAGSPFITQPEVAVLDSCGNTATSYEGPVTLVFNFGSMPPGAILSGTTTINAINGVAQFTDISINKTFPEYKLTATSEGLSQIISKAFKVSASTPIKLEFTVQPSGAIAGTPFEIQPKVAVVDIYGNVVTTSRASVTISITPDSGNVEATLSGTKTLVAESGLGGLAEFTDLSIDQAGYGYELTASSSGLESAISQAFDVAEQ